MSSTDDESASSSLEEEQGEGDRPQQFEWPRPNRDDPVVCAVDFGVENPAYWIGRFDSERGDFEYLANEHMPLPNPRRDKKVTRHESEKGLIDVLLREPQIESVTHFDLELQDPVALTKCAGPLGAQKKLAANVVAYGQGRAVAGALHAHFRSRPEYLRPKILFTHPSEKFRGFGIAKPRNYADRKKKSRDLETRYFERRSLQGTQREWHRRYAAHDKKDDLADAATAGKHRLRRLAHRRGKSEAARRRERAILAAALGSDAKADALLRAGAPKIASSPKEDGDISDSPHRARKR